MTTAYHEAGHAVTGRVLSLPCGYATIRPDYAKAIAGHVITPEPYARTLAHPAIEIEDDVKQLMNKHKELAALLLQEPDPWSA